MKKLIILSVFALFFFGKSAEATGQVSRILIQLAKPATKKLVVQAMKSVAKPAAKTTARVASRGAKLYVRSEFEKEREAEKRKNPTLGTYPKTPVPIVWKFPTTTVPKPAPKKKTAPRY